MTFVFAGVGVIHNHAMVAVAIGHVDFVCIFVDEDLRRPPQVLDVVAPLARADLADLHEEFSVLGEFHDHAVVGISDHRSGLPFRRWSARRLPARGSAAAAARRIRIGSDAISADPDVAFVIDRDAVVRVGPFVALARSAPMLNQIPSLVECENRWRGHAACRSRRIGGGVNFLRFERASAMNDPDMILRIR